MPTVSFRKANAADAEVVLGLIRELARYEHAEDEVLCTAEGLRTTLFANREAEVVLAQIERQELHPEDADAVGEDGLLTVGMAVFFQNFSTWTGKAGLYLEDLVVLEAYRGEGVGYALMGYLAALCVERGLPRFDWSCLDWNHPSLSFYQGLGAQRLDEWVHHRLEGDVLAALAATCFADPSRFDESNACFSRARSAASGHTVALVAAVDFNADDFLARYRAHAFSRVVAVDGGFSHLSAVDVVPDVALGDFDSLGYVPSAPRVLAFDAHKDASDLELAVDAALSEGATELYAYGCLSGRLDHTLAVLQLLARAAEAGCAVFAVGDSFAVRVLVGPDSFLIPVPRSVSVEEFRGTVSVFSACDCARGVTEKGLEYPLDNADLSNRTSLGLSNELIGKPATVALESGTLYVFYPLA